MNLTLRKPAELDVSTVSGISQAVLFRFFEADGTPMDVSGATFRCAVRGPGSTAIKCEAVDSSSSKLSWGKLYAGTYLYDVFMMAADGRELPLVKGSIIADARITPTGTQDITIICGEFDITMPDTEDGAVRITDSTTTAAERAEAASKIATDAVGEIIPLAEAAQNAANNSAQSSTAAANSATSAQQALAAIPTVDASGNMKLPGNLTANGATINGQLNANGGINIPVPPATDTDGVNRLYAAGLSAVIETMRVPLYLAKSKSTLTQGAFSEPVLGLVLSAPVAAKSRQMLSIGLDYTMHAASNYSQGLGWVLPLHSTVYGQLKVSVSYGHGVYTAASSDDMDAYEIYPTDASKQAYGAAMDIYLNQTNIGGNRAAVRTRVIYHDQVTGWMVRTITAHVDINNTGLISATSAIVYQQHSDRSGSGIKPDYGSIWLIRNGLASKNIVKIADVPGIHCFSGAKLNSPVLINGKAEDIYANMINVGAPVMQLACGNGRNPAYYGFQALETNAVISMTTAPYDPPTNV